MKLLRQASRLIVTCYAQHSESSEQVQAVVVVIVAAAAAAAEILDA
jgi:hypothetical protein